MFSALTRVFATMFHNFTHNCKNDARVLYSSNVFYTPVPRSANYFGNSSEDHYCSVSVLYWWRALPRAVSPETKGHRREQSCKYQPVQYVPLPWFMERVGILYRERFLRRIPCLSTFISRVVVPARSLVFACLLWTMDFGVFLISPLLYALNVTFEWHQELVLTKDMIW
jgi:hypothetical protein